MYIILKIFSPNEKPDVVRRRWRRRWPDGYILFIFMTFGQHIYYVRGSEGSQER